MDKTTSIKEIEISLEKAKIVFPGHGLFHYELVLKEAKSRECGHFGIAKNSLILPEEVSMLKDNVLYVGKTDLLRVSELPISYKYDFFVIKYKNSIFSYYLYNQELVVTISDLCYDLAPQGISYKEIFSFVLL